ncbi:efflux RND transporter periplasmic adaptor subunit [Roseicella aerolata]|uniref:Efflux RND transporter periplasmic adaptor subunit n=1 Tax=Roseicella aerolata TaxID=2883479 RepID=A0A9X1IHC0_9PROT|nr:efflux RND transporter periplasmic adaptor subunit [Roseicella aerolata]MCB4823085.1 efflux RND transporter periplasmic adaptor subunit [Roseicella aerolata]
MRRMVLAALIVPAAVGLGVGGYQAGRLGLVPGLGPAVASEQRQAGGPARPVSDRVLYYRHPDRPEYAAGPRRTQDGREFRAVYAGQDVEPEDPAAPATATAAAQPASGGPRRILYYRNPMGLPDTSPVPKKDSMGMDYIPVYEGEDQDGSTVRVAPGRIQATGVRSEPVARRELVRPVRAPGTIQLDERRVSVVALRTEAFVERVEDITTGDRVQRGQPLLRLYSPEVIAAGAQYISALGIPAGTSAVTADGARRRLENLGVPPQLLAEIERTRRIPQSFVWPAPRDGVVLERNVSDGMRMPAGEVLFRLADLSVIWALADLPERELGNIARGQRVEVRPRGLTGRSFTGRIDLIYPQLNPETRTARVRIELPNPEGALLPGMYVEAEIAAGGGGPVVAVPNSAVIDSGTRQVVILDRGEGRFEPKEVRLGRRGGGFVEIRDGVAEGDRVVVAANFLIDAESNLRAALRGLTAAAPAGEEGR